MTNIIQYYIDLNRELVNLYMEYPYIYVGCTLICAAWLCVTICVLFGDKETREVIKGFIKH